MTNRGYTWQEKRQAILDRDGEKCQYCGDEPEEPHVHHIQPRKDGGAADHWHNLVTLCSSCHKKLEVNDPGFQRRLLKKKGIREKVIGPPEDLSPWVGAAGDSELVD